MAALLRFGSEPGKVCSLMKRIVCAIVKENVNGACDSEVKLFLNNPREPI